jgi:hypothetical protein
MAVILAVPALGAQEITPPPIRAPIRSARRAAAKTSAHIEAEQHPERQTQRPVRPTQQHAPAGAQASAAGKVDSTSRAGTRRAGAAAKPAPEHADSAVITLTRETFSYTADGRRDPFVSLISSGDLRPMISDLNLGVIIYDPAGHSVAVLRDLTTNERYRVRVGDTLGRMRVAAIHPKSVTFTIEEFGYSRQAMLALNDSTTQ